jgi:hypothetical protein
MAQLVSFLRKSSSSSEIARVLSERWHVEEGKTKRHGVKHDASVSKEVLKQFATVVIEVEKVGTKILKEYQREHRS